MFAFLAFTFLSPSDKPLQGIEQSANWSIGPAHPTHNHNRVRVTYGPESEPPVNVWEFESRI